MDAHSRQQFELLLITATDRFAERLEQRNGGGDIAAERLRSDPERTGVWLSEFVNALFQDFLIDNAEGSAWILSALSRRKTPALPPVAGETVGAHMGRMARVAFGELLTERTAEALDARVAYGVGGMN